MTTPKSAIAALGTARKQGVKSNSEFDSGPHPSPLWHKNACRAFITAPELVSATELFVATTDASPLPDIIMGLLNELKSWH
jgi:hypothetical protein